MFNRDSPIVQSYARDVGIVLYVGIAVSLLQSVIGSKIVIDFATLSWVAHVRIKFEMFCQNTSL